MVKTLSTMAPLGSPAPDFSLKDTVSGTTMSLADFAGKKVLVVMFLCNHCPYVKHLESGLVQLGEDYANRNAALVAISSNDPVGYPDDAPDKLGAEARRAGYRFPLLFDETQDVAKATHAACTPDFFVYGPDRKLVYRGQFDPSRPGNGVPVTGSDLRSAIDAALSDQPPLEVQKASIGCNIKWKPGAEPDYFHT